jgi:hypothetical protein
LFRGRFIPLTAGFASAKQPANLPPLPLDLGSLFGNHWDTRHIQRLHIAVDGALRHLRPLRQLPRCDAPVSLQESYYVDGEMTDPRQRAKMLDEALDILVGLWGERPFSYHGEYYHVDEVTLLPQPVQTPRIPIWVGGGYPLKGPLQRAARWDGVCMYKNVVHYMLPDDVRALKTFIGDRRLTSEPFDIALGGSPRRDDWEEEQAYIRSLAEAGMTWWIEYVPPDDLEMMRACVKRGPLRVD